MIDMKCKNLMMYGVMGVMLMTATPVHAMAHSSGGHASTGTHASTSHTTASRGVTSTSRPSSSTTTRSVTTGAKPTSMPTKSTSTTSGKNTATQSITAKPLPTNEATRTALNSTYKSSTYHSLADPRQRNSYSYWHGYYGINSLNATSAYSRMGNSYFWLPYWMMYSNQTQKETQVVKETAKKRHMKWIKVDNDVVYIPESIYRKVKVGDKVNLLDDTHIQINNKIYKR